MSTLTEREILNVNAVTMNVATSDVSSQLPERRSSRNRRPDFWDYFISTQLITLSEPCPPSVSIVDQPTEALVSPAWLGRAKKRLKELAGLPPNWDSYGALAVDPCAASIAEELIEWFAVDDMPPPDVFATSDGGVQIDWHIRRVNVVMEISPTEGSSIYFHDLNSGDPWSRPASEADLRTVRRRLLERP